MKLVDADALIHYLRYNNCVVYETPEITVMEFLSWAPRVECRNCKSWNEARFDDWGCCESDELSFKGNFNTQMGGSFGCTFYKPQGDV